MRRLESEMMPKPKCFEAGNTSNVLVESDNSFERVCMMLQENGVVDPKNLTEFEFYARLKYFEERHKQK